MRRLLYVPIVHEVADMGSIGASLLQRSSTLSGPERWATHQETVRQFWKSVGDYLWPLDVSQLKIYQDGLPAEGDLGRHIAEEAAKRGSSNYQLVVQLLERGAELRKTEDPGLLLLEHEDIVASLELAESGGREPDTQRHGLQRDRTMADRDRFIAETINATLGQDEQAVLFIGAQHRVVELLAPDISIEMVKDPRWVEAYVKELFVGRDDALFEELRQYVISPVRRCDV